MPKFSDRPKALKVSDFNHYLNDEIQLGYYQEINVAGSTETEVDAFYDSFLRDVFTKKQKFRVDMEARVAEKLNMRKADFTIRYVQLGVPKKVILCENKRREFASRPAQWAAALQQAVGYCRLVRASEKDSDRTLYITVNIGTYLRFYELPPRSSAVKDWAPGGGIVYELADDESKFYRDLEFSEYWRLATKDTSKKNPTGLATVGHGGVAAVQ
ncbi:hypothetical protein NHJ13051_008805 [Beauveria bassiana]